MKIPPINPSFPGPDATKNAREKNKERKKHYDKSEAQEESDSLNNDAEEDKKSQRYRSSLLRGNVDIDC